MILLLLHAHPASEAHTQPYDAQDNTPPIRYHTPSGRHFFFFRADFFDNRENARFTTRRRERCVYATISRRSSQSCHVRCVCPSCFWRKSARKIHHGRVCCLEQHTAVVIRLRSRRAYIPVYLVRRCNHTHTGRFPALDISSVGIVLPVQNR